MALAPDLVLADAQRLATSDQDHLAHEIDAGDHLGHGMLDLDAGIHLEEVEVLREVVEQELERAGAAIVDGFGERHRRFADFLALVFFQRDGGRLLPHLLAAALQRTFPLEAVDDVAAITEDLHLDVARAFDELLDIEPTVTERSFRLGLGLRHELGKLVLGARDANAATAATGRRLDHDGKAGLLDEGVGFFGRFEPALTAGHGRHSGSFGRIAGGDLVAHEPDELGRRPDEHETGRLDGCGELGVLGEEAIARMNRIGAGRLGGGDDGVLVEIGLRCMRRADVDRFIGELDGEHVRIGLAVDLGGRNAQLLRRTDDPDGDLAAIGYEQFLNGHGVATNLRFLPAAGRPSPVPRSRR